MPQVDTLVNAVAGGVNDRKITCETLAPNDNGESSSDFPPESFYVPKNDESDWLDRNAFIERKDSAKGINNNNDQNAIANSNNPHQKFSINLKSTASIIGLPKGQKATLAGCRQRTCRPANMIRIFPKRTGSTEKSTAGQMAEPGSPKVSCMGRVKSKRCRRRSNSLKRGVKQGKDFGSGGEKQKSTFYSKVTSIFRSKKSLQEAVVVEPRQTSVSAKVRETPRAAEPEVEPPVLGGMKRFASGRQSGSLIAEEFNQVNLDRRVSKS